MPAALGPDRYLPRGAGTLVGTYKMEPAIAIPDCRHDVERVANQQVNAVRRGLVAHQQHNARFGATAKWSALVTGQTRVLTKNDDTPNRTARRQIERCRGPQLSRRKPRGVPSRYCVARSCCYGR
jgi:hypothetical protein